MSVFDNYQCEGQLTLGEIYGQDIWSGKTFPEPSVQIKERTSDASLKKRSVSSKKMPLFLDLRGGRSGVLPVQSWEMGGLLLGAYTMHSFGECPKEERESRLSQILEDHPHLKYCLSAKACQGILNRAEKRGKELPEILKITLLKQSAFKNEQDVRGGARESSFNTNEQEHCQPSIINRSCKDADVQGVDSYNLTTTGAVSKTLQAERADNKHIPCAIYSMGHDERSARFTDDEITDPLTACDHKDPIKICIGVDAYNQSETGEKAMSITGAATDPHHIPCVTVSQDAYDKYTENEKSASLKQSGGNLGGAAKR